MQALWQVAPHLTTTEGEIKMAKIVKTYITTDDTNLTYELDGTYKEHKTQLWAVSISIDAVDQYGNYSFTPHTSKKTFFVERQTLERLGMVSYSQTKAPELPRTKEDDIRETLEKLLSLVGVYPAE